MKGCGKIIPDTTRLMEEIPEREGRNMMPIGYSRYHGRLTLDETVALVFAGNHRPFLGAHVIEHAIAQNEAEKLPESLHVCPSGLAGIAHNFLLLLPDAP